MNFEISKKHFNAICRQILQGRKADSPDLVDMTAERDSLTVVVTGRSIDVPIEAMERGSFSIPIGVLFKMKRISGTYDEPKFRIRISDGKFGLQGMTTAHPEIKARPIARRVIDIPEDAAPLDLLSLPFIFSVDEIEDCGLHAKLLEAQRKLAESLTSAYETLCSYGFDRNELSLVAEQKIKAHSEAMKPVLFAPDEKDSSEPPISYAEWIERRKVEHSNPSPEIACRRRRMQECLRAVENNDRFAFLYAEWADRSQFEFTIGWDTDMFSDEMIEQYRKTFPDTRLGESPWWEA